VILVAALGLAIAYGVWGRRNARRDPESERAREEATRQVYREG
jgi:hypothetical protein